VNNLHHNIAQTSKFPVTTAPSFSINQLIVASEDVEYPIEIGDQPLIEDMLIIHLDISRDSVFLINARTTPRAPLKVSFSALLADIECFNVEICDFHWEPRVMRSFEALSDYEQTKVKTRFSIIESLVENLDEFFHRRYGSYLVSKTARQHNLTRQTVYNYLYGYFYYGRRKNALCLAVGKELHRAKKTRCIQVKQGRPPKYTSQGKVLDESDFKAFKQAVSLMEDKSARTFIYAYKIMLNKSYFQSKVALDNTTARLLGTRFDVILKSITERPTKNQFMYWLGKQYGPKKSQLRNARLQKAEPEKDFNGRRGNAYANIIAPGQLYEIDETPFDEEIISHLSTPENTIYLGKPTIYVVKDVFTRYIVGFYITCSNPSYDTFRKAIFDVCRDRLQWLKSLNCEDFLSEWEPMGLPQTILVDNAELNNSKSEGLASDLGITISFGRPSRGDDKPHIESIFNSLPNFLPSMSQGHKRAGEIGQRRNDARGHACHTIDDLNFIIMMYCCQSNNHKVHEGVNRDLVMLKDEVSKIPRELLAWGQKNRPGYLKKFDDFELAMKLLPRGTVSIRQKGVYLKELQLEYTSPEILASGMQDRPSKGASRSKLFPCRYDPENLDIIYIEIDDGLIEARLDEKHRLYAGKSQIEVAKLQERQKIMDIRDKELAMNTESGVITSTEDIVKKAKKNRSKNSPHDISRIRENRKIEQQLRNQNEYDKNDLGHKREVITQDMNSFDKELIDTFYRNDGEED